MSDPTTEDYYPNDTFPDLQNRDGNGPLLFEQNGNVLNHFYHWGKTSEIASVSNTTPIVITTTVAHKMSTGQRAAVRDTTVDGADGDWTITVLSPTTFSLDTSTADGSSTGDGTTFALQIGLLGRILDGLWYLGKRLTGEFFDTGIIWIKGRKARRARVPLTAADHSIETADGDSFQLATFAMGGPFTITLLSTTADPVPEQGERMILYTGINYAPSGTAWIIQREDGTDICWFIAKPSTEQMAVGAEFEYYSGAWRLGLNTGYDTTPLMGVLPKAGA